MTQEELRSRIERVMYSEYLDDSKSNLVLSDEVMALINQHVAEVIGEDEKCSEHSVPIWKCKTCAINPFRTELRAEQRRRAGL